MAQRKSAGSKSPGAKSPSEGRLPEEIALPVADQRRHKGEAQALIIAAGGVAALRKHILDGGSIAGFATSLGLGRSSVVEWVNSDSERSATIREARALSAAAHEERAEQLLEASSDPFSLAKARELAHHLRWRASKIAPREYGERVAHGGDADAPPIKHSVAVRFVQPGGASD